MTNDTTPRYRTQSFPPHSPDNATRSGWWGLSRYHATNQLLSLLCRSATAYHIVHHRVVAHRRIRRGCVCTGEKQCHHCSLKNYNIKRMYLRGGGSNCFHHKKRPYYRPLHYGYYAPGLLALLRTVQPSRLDR